MFKRQVLIADLKCVRESKLLMPSGKEFHNLDAATEKDVSLYRISCKT